MNDEQEYCDDYLVAGEVARKALLASNLRALGDFDSFRPIPLRKAKSHRCPRCGKGCASEAAVLQHIRQKARNHCPKHCTRKA